MTTPPSGNDPYQPYGQPSDPSPYGSQPQGQPPYGQPSEPSPYGGQPQGQPYGAPYGQPTPPFGYAPPPATNGLAIASLVVSLVSLVVCAGFTGFVGAILGHVSKSQISRSNEQGAGLALAGIIVGWLGFALFIALVVGFIALGVWAENSIDDCYTRSDGVYRCD
jgi:hypothetical protein